MRTIEPRKHACWLLAGALCVVGCAGADDEIPDDDVADSTDALNGGDECSRATIFIADAHGINVDINGSGYRRDESNIKGTLTRSSGATYEVRTDDDIPINGLVRRALRMKSGGATVTLRRGDSLRLTLIIDRPFINGLVGWHKNDKECAPITLRY